MVSVATVVEWETARVEEVTVMAVVATAMGVGDLVEVVMDSAAAAKAMRAVEMV